jgi:hypothetical protein
LVAQLGVDVNLRCGNVESGFLVAMEAQLVLGLELLSLRPTFFGRSLI